MNDWREFERSASEWDAALALLGGANFYQSHAWGEVKKKTGWRVLRLSRAGIGGSGSALAQVLIRTYPIGLIVAWLPGGVAGLGEDSLATLPAAIMRASAGRRAYIRMNALYPFDAEQAGFLSGQGWKRPVARLTSGSSLRHNLDAQEGERLSRTSGNWRHNLKRSGRQQLATSIWNGADAGALQAVYREMERYKNLAPQTTETELAACLGMPAERVLLVRCTDASGATLALRACGLFGETGWDLLAAATPAARKVYASHATLWKLLSICAERGMKVYDLGGVDPEGNKGVFDFKNGVGAERIEYLGEWEWASNLLVRHAANAVIHRRRGRL